MKNRFFLVAVFVIATLSGCTESKKVVINDNLSLNASLLYAEDFNSDLSNWKPEQDSEGKVFINNEKMEIDDANGCTVWFTKELEGSIMIEYDAFVIDNGGAHDRVSDLNCFWMATDPENPTNLFKNSKQRDGKFQNYDSLQLYYVGLGGHFNTKTRFRRYVGNGEKPLLPEHDLTAPEMMIQANTLAQIRLIAHNGIIQYYRNGVLIFDFEDENPYTSGYFGLRTVDNHMTVDNFRVYQLSE